MGICKSKNKDKRREMKNVDTTDQEITCVGLFTGGGALELGVRRIMPNLRVVAYVEIEAYAAALLAKKIERGELDEAPIFTDVTKFPAEEFRDKVHLVVAGYPCQDFSTAGKRAGLEGNRGKMWGFTRAVVSRLRARAFFGENVEGHLSLGFDTVVSDLGDDGFLVKAGLYSAFEVGAPHLRKRIFSLSFRTDPNVEPWSKSRKGNQGWRDLEDAEFQAITTGRVVLANPTDERCERSSEPGEGCTQEATSGCGDRDGQLGDTNSKGSQGYRGEHGLREGGQEMQAGGSSNVADTDNSRSREDIKSTELRTSGIEQSSQHSGGAGEREGGEEQEELADPGSDGLLGGGLGHMGEEMREARGADAETITNSGSAGYARGVHEEWSIRWPSRPGCKQHDWEAPRVLGNPEHDGSPATKVGGGHGEDDDGGKKGEDSTKQSSGTSRPQDDGGMGNPEDIGCRRADDECEEEGTTEGEHTLRSSGESSEEQETQSIMGRESDAVTRGLHSNRIDRLRMLGNGVVWLSAAKAFSELLEQQQQDWG
jgi:DNA (cytosine-5)-methyltransferase 1